jgi:hypothetical protein
MGNKGTREPLGATDSGPRPGLSLSSEQSRAAARAHCTLSLAPCGGRVSIARRVQRRRYGKDLPYYWGAFVLVSR